MSARVDIDRLVACALFAAAAFAPDAWSITVEPEVQPQPAVVAAPKARLADASRIFNVTLPRASLSPLNKSASAASRMGVPLQIGFGREVPALASSGATAGHLDWQRLAGGSRVAAFSVTSTEAASLRVGLRIYAMPAAALVRFYAPLGEVFEATGAQIKESVERNLNAGEEGEDARTYWSPVIEGATAVVEVELPEGVALESFSIAAPAVSHLVTSPGLDFRMPVDKAAAASCELDVMCYGAWAAESNSEARITFIDGASSYLCSGTLLADNVAATQVPYFLTANHCISTQASASSMQSYWFYRASSCNAGTRGASPTLTDGATLLYARDVTDTSFMRLNSTPPGGAVYAGWSVGSIPALGASVVGIHHPRGDLQKISFGNLTSYAACVDGGNDQFTCRYAGSTSGTFFESTWTSGITEAGSSGSGLFLANGHYLVGQLYGGTGSCTASGSDFYGRFDVAYNAGLAPFLSGTSSGPGGAGNPTPIPGAPSAVPAFDYSALWWNPSESGWGLTVAQHNAFLFAAWFVYNSSGNPRWVVMPGGTWTSPTSITGDLYSTSGPPSTAPFDPSQVVTTRVGRATLSFSGADNAVLAYTVDGVSGTKTITKEVFGAPDPTPTANYSDLWWNASESGWGVSIVQQNRTLFAVWYTYGLYGQPLWYVMPGGTWNGNTYTGALFRTTSAPAPFFGASFDTRGFSAVEVGSMSFTFAGTNAATMAYTIDGAAGTKAITRQPF